MSDEESKDRVVIIHGNNSIHLEPRNRIVVPRNVFGFNVLREDGTIHWGHLTSEPYWVVITRNEDKIKDEDDYNYIETTQLGDNGATTFPKPFFNDWIPPDNWSQEVIDANSPHPEAMMEYGMNCYFASDSHVTPQHFICLLKHEQGIEFHSNL